MAKTINPRSVVADAGRKSPRIDNIIGYTINGVPYSGSPGATFMRTLGDDNDDNGVAEPLLENDVMPERLVLYFNTPEDVEAFMDATDRYNQTCEERRSMPSTETTLSDTYDAIRARRAAAAKQPINVTTAQRGPAPKLSNK